MASSFLESVTALFQYYKRVGEAAMEQTPEKLLFVSSHENENSISTLVKHLHGNMLSRWTDFLSSDGEKDWRNRDREFEVSTIVSREAIKQLWEEGWNVLLNTLSSLDEHDLDKVIYIRNEGHLVTEAIHRQLAHYAYHVGQIVFLAKQHVGEHWQSLSIPKGASKTYNQEKFQSEKKRQHFTKKT